MKISRSLFVTITTIGLFSSCTPPLLLCLLEFSGNQKQFDFNFSKDELKDRIIEAYSYDVSVARKIFGTSCIEEISVNQKYRQSADIWLDKSNWDNFKTEIRNNTQDTLTILIGKHLSRKLLKFRMIIGGGINKSVLTIEKMEYKQQKNCDKKPEYYHAKLVDKIEMTFIDKLKRKDSH